MAKKIKIGLFGAGHLGKVHLKCLQNTDFEVIGIFDPNTEAQQFVTKNYGVPIFFSEDELIDCADAIDIVSTTSTHYDIAIKAINKGKHTFIEKPISSSLHQAKEILKAVTKTKVKVQIGHVERYNPAVVTLKHRDINPKFIEGHRLATFNNRGNDVSVILDLMIHDLDLVLALVDSDVIDVQANGVCVINNTPDICNTRLTFANGCVANLTASRISQKQMRKLRLFQENEYISLDFLKKECQIISLRPLQTGEKCDGMTVDTADGKKEITFNNPEVVEHNAIEEELKDFYNSIANNTQVVVDVTAGMRALELAYEIAKKVEE